MKTMFALLVLFSVALGQQQVKAQSAKTYEEWKKSTPKKRSKTATKPAKATKAKTTAKAEEKTAAPAAMAAPTGTFSGTFPCTDCQGINTELVLNGGADGSSRSFTMKQTYLGKPADKSIVTSSGKWFLAKGNKQNPDAVVLQLIPTEGNIDPMYFLQVSDSEVKLLDRQQAEMQGQQRYSLKKR
ncbi:copper resistance protein NlpE [Pontibacter diazotrophicus]|uniref:Copper resistance protein NlpE n=1 Tax=Pontibacter diazotrophicus TaxID=1400979 RepID=A0A3D8L8D9_9BACT|nr:copper resistance protein NlpE [Pontibacter diazotrophicus]RDV13648.1 copper resistance protein NlpE [Pontibacter diazotrophicus]